MLDSYQPSLIIIFQTAKNWSKNVNNINIVQKHFEYMYIYIFTIRKGFEEVPVL